MGDFNIDFKNKEDFNLEKLNNFCDIFSPTNQVECHTCFTKTHKTSIDLLLTNRKSSFQLTQATETGICIMKVQTVRLKPPKKLFLETTNTLMNRLSRRPAIC